MYIDAELITKLLRRLREPSAALRELPFLHSDGGSSQMSLLLDDDERYWLVRGLELLINEGDLLVRQKASWGAYAARSALWMTRRDVERLPLPITEDYAACLNNIDALIDILDR